MFITLTFGPTEPGSSPSDRRRARLRRRRWQQAVVAAAPRAVVDPEPLAKAS